MTLQTDTEPIKMTWQMRRWIALFCFWIFLWLIPTAGIVRQFRLSRRQGVSNSRIDLSQYAQLPPGKGIALFYLLAEQRKSSLVTGSAYLTVRRRSDKKSWPGCLATAYECGSSKRIIGQWLFSSDQLGFTFWGEPEIKYLRSGLTIPRIATVGQTETVPVVWINKEGKQEADTCSYGLIQGQQGLYTLIYRFEKNGEFGLIFSLARKSPSGLHIVRP